MILRLLFVIISFLSVPTFAQDVAKIEVRYQLKFISDSTNRNKVVYADLTLLCNENKSIYFSRDTKVYYDYLNRKAGEMVGGKINLGILPSYPKVRGNVYKEGSKVIATLPVGKYNYAFEEPELKWELLTETRNIDGLICNSAKTTTDTGDVFVAWYTTEYQFQEGPFRFKNLPGLIVKVENRNKTIVISAIEISKSNELIAPISLGEIIKLNSKERFLQARAAYHENPKAGEFGDHIIIIDDKGTDYSKMLKNSLNTQNVFLD
ncbi:GLPGLI family protein [Kaistella polysaccharea]|uniref:GLPGLI family protein n=1 Tax=Kaistella polysaccharea TaxID=2878534 RepID=UPI001CF55ED8|nr:GLPGLI family protein [Kaistella polysaccharea]